MRFVVVQPYHLEYVQQFYQKNPYLYKTTFSEQLKTLNSDFYLWGDSWLKTMRVLGYECTNLIPNIIPLQSAWAKENDIKEQTIPLNCDSITVMQLKKIKPDVIFLYQSSNDSLIRHIKDEVPSLKLLIYWAGSPVPKSRNLSGIDLVLTCSPELLDQTASRGVETRLLSHAFDPEVNSRLKSKNKTYDVLFSGRLVRFQDYHLEREKILKRLLGKVPINILTPSYYINVSIRDYVKTGLKSLLYIINKSLSTLGVPSRFISEIPAMKKIQQFRSFPVLPVDKTLKEHFEPPVYGLDMFQALRNASITLNIHGDATNHVSAMRVFEATGVGSCLLTDWKADINEYFDDDREVMTFKTVDECIFKIKWLLANEKERIKIADAGQKKTLTNHTYSKRALILDEIIKSLEL